MSPQYEFPIAGAGTHQPELFIRDIEFLNYHINHDKWDWWRMFDIVDAHRDQDDFDIWLATDYTITIVGAGTQALADEPNGVLVVTNAAANNDVTEIVRDAETFLLQATNPLYAEMRFHMPEVIQSEFWFGLVTGDVWFPAATPDDFVVFHKDDADIELEFECSMNGVATNVNTGVNLVNDTWYRIGFHFDGAGTLRWFIFTDGDEPQYCVAAGTVTTHIPTDEYMTIGFGIMNGEAVAKALSVDYWKCVQKRVIE